MLEHLKLSYGSSRFAFDPTNALRRASEVGSRFRVTATVGTLTLLAAIVPSSIEWLQLDFAATLDGQWWRIFTGHMTHFGSQHLFWDLLMFVVLASLCEFQHPKTFGALLSLIALIVSATVMLFCGDVANYRGLSGVDTGLFVWFIGDQYRLSRKQNDKTYAMLWGTLGFLLLGKLFYEMVTGELLFVSVEGFKPLVESHVSGGLAGLLALFLLNSSIQKRFSGSGNLAFSRQS